MENSPRWVALALPWCTYLRGRLRLCSIHTVGGYEHGDEGSWCIWVNLSPYDQTEQNDRVILQAIHILSMVARIDKHVWQALLLEKCQVETNNPDKLIDDDPVFLFYSFENTSNGNSSERHLRWLKSLSSHFTAGIDQNVIYRNTVEKLLKVLNQTSESLAAQSRNIRIILRFNPEFSAEDSYALSAYLHCAIELVQCLQTHRETSYANFILESLDICFPSFRLTGENTTLLDQLVSLNDVKISALHLNLEKHIDHHGVMEALGHLFRHVVGCCISVCIPPLDQTECCGSSTDERELREIAVHGPQSAPEYFVAFCSAVAYCECRCDLSMNYVLEDDPPTLRMFKWKWLAYALFSRNAASPTQFLSFNCTDLQMSDIEAISSIINAEYPLKELIGVLFDDPSPQESQMVHLRKGTIIEIISVYPELADQNECLSSVRLVSDGKFDLINSSSKTQFTYFLVPGYGVCRVQNDAIMRREVKNMPMEPPFQAVRGVSICLAEGNDDHLPAIAAFVKLLGAGLQYLQLYDRIRHSFLAEILNYCYDVTHLKLNHIQVDSMDVFVRAVEEQNYLQLISLDIERLECRSSESVTLFARTLGNPNHAMSRSLKHLSIGDFDGVSSTLDANNLNAFLSMLETNRVLSDMQLYVEPNLYAKFANAFEQFNGEPLPVVSEKFPLSCRLAFLSVIRDTYKRGLDGEKLPRYALNRHVCGLIFEFAAIPVQRYVKIYDRTQ